MLVCSLSRLSSRVNTQNPQMLMAQNPTKFGWNLKQGGGFKSWKRRFFVLVNDKLYYFEKENSREPQGFLVLDRTTAVNNTFVKGKQSEESIQLSAVAFCSRQPSTTDCFAIKTTKRTYLVSASSVAEADDWCVLL